MNEQTESNFDLLHVMRDVIVLLGGRVDIADLLEALKDGQVSEADVLRAKSYAMDLTKAHKGCLASVHMMTLRVNPPEQP